MPITFKVQRDLAKISCTFVSRDHNWTQDFVVCIPESTNHGQFFEMLLHMMEDTNVSWGNWNSFFLLANYGVYIIWNVYVHWITGSKQRCISYLCLMINFEWGYHYELKSTHPNQESLHVFCDKIFAFNCFCHKLQSITLLAEHRYYPKHVYRSFELTNTWRCTFNFTNPPYRPSFTSMKDAK